MRTLLQSIIIVGSAVVMSYGCSVSRYYSMPMQPGMVHPPTHPAFGSTPYPEDEMKRKWRAAEDDYDARMTAWKDEVEQRRRLAAKSGLSDLDATTMFWGGLAALCVAVVYSIVRFFDERV